MIAKKSRQETTSHSAAATEEKSGVSFTWSQLEFSLVPEMEFVHPVSAGGSVKFLPAV